MKVRDLKGAALDWAVAKVEGLTPDTVTVRTLGEAVVSPAPPGFYVGHAEPIYFSTDPAQAYPIIAREGIDLRQIKQVAYELLDLRHFDAEKGDVVCRPEGRKRDMVRRPNKPHPLHGKWMARMSRGTGATVTWTKEDFVSDTPLEAAMRCWVAHNLGAEIDIPKELL